MRAVMSVALAAILVMLAPANAQMRIVQDGWEGFEMSPTSDTPAQCVLYNRKVDAININPYDMIGLQEDAAGKLSLLVFLQPNSLTRGPRVPVTVKLDQLTLYLAGDAVSDFHIMIPGPFDARAVKVLRDAHTIEVGVQRHNYRFDVEKLGAALDKLDACIKPVRKDEPAPNPAQP